MTSVFTSTATGRGQELTIVGDDGSRQPDEGELGIMRHHDEHVAQLAATLKRPSQRPSLMLNYRMLQRFLLASSVAVVPDGPAL